MGFLYLAIKLPKAITLGLLINMVSHLKFMVIAALTRVGLYKSPAEEEESSSRMDNFVLILDGSSPSLVPIPVHVVTSAIKKKVPVLFYGEFLSGDEREKAAVCTVCLDLIEKSHEIRELINCNHLFHRECLDTWVDQGQITCPLCRSMLLPPKKFLTAGDSTVM